MHLFSVKLNILLPFLRLLITKDDGSTLEK